EHTLDIETRASGEIDSLGKGLQQSRDADLIDHFGELPGAGSAKQRDRTRVGGEDGLCFREHVRVAANHHGELAALGAGLSARHGSVEKSDLARFGGGVELAG